MRRATLVHIFGAALACGALSLPAFAQKRPQIPLWDAPAIERICSRALLNARKQVLALERPAPRRHGPEPVFAAWDRMQIAIEDVQGPIELHANVSPDAATRAAAEACQLRFTSFTTDLLQNERIYQQFRQATPADPTEAKLKKDVLEEFEDKGVALAPDKRARMKAILLRLEELRQSFDRNIRDNKTRVAFTPDEMKGLPASYTDKARRGKGGDYLLGFEYPEYEPFMANAENEDARRRYQIAFTNRGTPENLVLLAEAARLRREIAQLYELPSYAHFVVRRRMAASPESVLRFLEEVKGKVREAERREHEELRALKAERLGKRIGDVALNRWDIAYYQEQLRKSRYSIDQEALRAYFPTDATVAWALSVSGQLYGVRFVERKVPVWHASVRYYDVLEGATGAFLSGMYLDLFPREGKYGHAAAFGVRSASLAARRTPVSALVANFNRKGLDFRELEILMHEFGHVLHGVLSRTRYASHGGTNVERDFVEAPSQMYEEWARRKETLQMIRGYCADCPVVDDALVRRLQEARRYGAGTRYARQHLYAAYDMALSGERSVEPLQAWIAMERETPAGHESGTEFPGTFGHLMSGYAAGYYGYMWSEVLALDMLSAFRGDPMNAAAGRRFREAILAQGGQRRAADMVRDFLGRDPSPEAFFAEITGRRTD